MKPDEIPCPNCGELLVGDVHSEELKAMDNWICHNCWTVLTRKDDYIKENLDEEAKNER